MAILSEMNQNGSLKTDDLALATYLRCNDLRYKLERDKRDDDMLICIWVFPSSDKSRRLLEQYVSRTATVEPNKFVRAWGVIRKEMLDFLRNP